MITTLLQRPVAVFLTFLIAIVLGAAALLKLPVSLLPDIEVPQLTVHVRFESASPEVLESVVMEPLRNALSRTEGLKDIESYASEGQGFLYLEFEFGTAMDMVCLEVNERIDRVLGILPRELPRPVLLRSGTSDIPIIRLQVIPKREGDLGVLSALTDRIIRRKLEQIPGVSLVDMHGLHGEQIVIHPRSEVLHALGIDERQILRALVAANQEFGTFSVMNGHYRYFVRVESAGSNGTNSVGEIPVQVGRGHYLPLAHLATFSRELKPYEGYHLYNGKKALVVQIRKKAEARMDEVAPKIQEVVEEMRRSHPEALFVLTRDQSVLLNAGIGNLYQVIAWGSLLATLILFLFIGRLSLGLVLGLTIPVSLLIVFGLFHCFGLSLNILSLSGLALGVGMLIDHSIIVLDAITEKIKQGKGGSLACSEGPELVFVPVLGQTLTSVAVYGPLVLMPGLAGILVADQALALSLSLGVSLAVAFIIVPLICRVVFAFGNSGTPSDTPFFQWILRKYHVFLEVSSTRKTIFFGIAVIFVLSAIWLVRFIPLEALPEMEKKETLLRIDWREPIALEENLRRIRKLDTLLSPLSASREVEVGPLQFALSPEGQAVQQAQIYYTCQTGKDRALLDQQVEKWMERFFPIAGYRCEAAPNALNQLFASRKPYMEVRIRAGEGDEDTFFEKVLQALSDFPYANYQRGPGLVAEAGISIYAREDRLAMHRLTREAIAEKIGTLLGKGLTVHGPGEAMVPMQLRPSDGQLGQVLAQGIRTPEGSILPLSYFTGYSGRQTPAGITSDKSGRYYALELDRVAGNREAVRERIEEWAHRHHLEIQFAGRYLESGQNLLALAKVFLLALLLLYFILALQFNHLLLPLVVMSALAFGASGALWLLYLSGTTFNIMAGIGFVIVLGIIIDDPILKVEVILREWDRECVAGSTRVDSLDRAVEASAAICLKPMLMTTMTTVFALVPVFFSSGIGAELQRPLALVVVGGLMVGTFFTTWCIPLLFRAVMKKQIRG